MSEKAQEVRKRRIENMQHLKNAAEKAFELILEEFDRRTKLDDYSPVELLVNFQGIPNIQYHGNCSICNDVIIHSKHEKIFFKILEEMFKDEEGYTANLIDSSYGGVLVQIDIV